MKLFQKIKNLFSRKTVEETELEEEFYGIIKLISGEEIFALILPEEKEDETLLVLQNPLMMKVINHPHGMHLKVKPWIEISDDDIYIINFDKVLTMTETTDQRLIEIFNNYIEEEISNDDPLDIHQKNNGNDSSKISRKMGYISSVEDAREQLENIFNIKDTKES